MRSLKLFAGLVLLPLTAVIASPALADGGNLCLTGALGASGQSINCGSNWVAANGTRFGPVPDPRNTPRTPYRPPGAVWSGSSASSATYNSGYTTTSSPVWQASVQSQYPVHTNTVTHGSYYQQPTITHNNWSTASHISSGSCAPINSTCSSQQISYRSHNITNGCFSYDNNGQAHSVPCPANVTHSNTWNHSQQHQNCGFSVIAHTTQAHAQVAVVHTDGFFNTLNGGVGGGSNVYYGGGGGAVISGGSSRVFSQAPLLRIPNKNVGNGGGAPKKNYHGGGGGGGGKGSHKGGHK